MAWSLQEQIAIDQVKWIASVRAGLISPTPLSDDAKTTLTGLDTNQFSSAFFGKATPLFVGGQALMGCRLGEGPFLYTEGGINKVDFIATPGVVATPTATRTFTYLSLNGTKVWTPTDGVLGGGVFGDMTVEVKPGSETQTPFASSIARYGSQATPYRSNILVEIKKCPLSVFDNIIPFPSLYVYETESITRNAALAVLARYSRFDAAEYEFNVSGSDRFWIVPDRIEFIQYIKQFKTLFSNWNITVTDKLRVFENGSNSDVVQTITRSNASQIKLVHLDPLSVPSERWFGFVDIERDNDMNEAPGTLERFPVPVASSQGSQTIQLPVGTTLAAAKLVANKSLLIEDIGRKRIAFVGNNEFWGTQAGDIFDHSITGITADKLRVISAIKQAKDFSTEIEAAVVKVPVPLNVAPVITSNGGADSASLSVPENTTVVTTVTATDANDDNLTFSIVGGADAALFSIGITSGVLAFLIAPDYEVPTDANTDNDYIVAVQVTDGFLTDTQTLTVTITDASEAGAEAMITEDGEPMLTEDGEPIVTEG